MSCALTDLGDSNATAGSTTRKGLKYGEIIFRVRTSAKTKRATGIEPD